MSTLNLWNYVSHVNLGSEDSAKQGAVSDAPQTPFSVTVTGDVFTAKKTLATATARTLWTSSSFPGTFAYGHFWASGICYFQRITAAGSIVDKVAAYQPLVFPGYSGCVPTNSTSAIAGGTEPTLAALASIVIGNYTGSTFDYCLKLFL